MPRTKGSSEEALLEVERLEEARLAGLSPNPSSIRVFISSCFEVIELMSSLYLDIMMGACGVQSAMFKISLTYPLLESANLVFISLCNFLASQMKKEKGESKFFLQIRFVNSN